MIHIRTAGLTDTGRVRNQNEDALLLDDERRIYAVADGLGGLPDGAVASSMAIDNLVRGIKKSNGESPPDWNTLFNDVNEVVFRHGRTIHEELGIGTTLTAIAVLENSFVIGHVGDCAVILSRDSGYLRITRDHTMKEEIMARKKPWQTLYIPEYFAHTLTRCIGQAKNIEPDVIDLPFGPGERLILCSDGITKVLEDGEVHHECLIAPTPQDLIERLIFLANERGGPDNATAIAIFASEAV